MAVLVNELLKFPCPSFIFLGVVYTLFATRLKEFYLKIVKLIKPRKKLKILLFLFQVRFVSSQTKTEEIISK